MSFIYIALATIDAQVFHFQIGHVLLWFQSWEYIQSHILCGCLELFYPQPRLPSPLCCSGDDVEIVGKYSLISSPYLP